MQNFKHFGKQLFCGILDIKNRIQRKSALKTVFSTSVEFGKQRSSRVSVSVLCLSDALFKNKLIRSLLELLLVD